MKLIIRGSNLYVIFLFTVLLSSCNKPVQINQSKSEDSNNETIKKNTITEILAKPQVPVCVIIALQTEEVMNIL